MTTGSSRSNHPSACDIQKCSIHFEKMSVTNITRFSPTDKHFSLRFLAGPFPALYCSRISRGSLLRCFQSLSEACCLLSDLKKLKPLFLVSFQHSHTHSSFPILSTLENIQTLTMSPASSSSSSAPAKKGYRFGDLFLKPLLNYATNSSPEDPYYFGKLTTQVATAIYDKITSTSYASYDGFIFTKHADGSVTVCDTCNNVNTAFANLRRFEEELERNVYRR